MRATKTVGRETLLRRVLALALGERALTDAGKRHDFTSIVPRGRVFLCYRRQDTADAAGRLYDDLVERYGEDAVFFDIDSLPLGVNFKVHIENELQRCAAMLVMIGRNWTTLTDENGKRRLDDPTDPVRIEVAAALRQNVRVIPLLVHDVPLPRASDLPEDIQQLAFQHGMRLLPEFWRAGVQRLLTALDSVIG